MINTIIDTSVILDGKSNIEQLSKDSNLFVTDIILQELDGNKNSDGSVGYNAKDFFRTLSRDKGEDCVAIPSTNKPLQYSDTLRRMYFGLIPLYVFVRKNYKTKNINDSKIIEIAKDYDFKLVTNDVAQRVRALSEGVNADMFEKAIEKKHTNCVDTNLEYESAIEKSLRLEKEGNIPVFKNNNSFDAELFGKSLATVIFLIPFGIFLGLVPIGIIPMIIMFVFIAGSAIIFLSPKEQSKVTISYEQKKEHLARKKINSSDDNILVDSSSSNFSSGSISSDWIADPAYSGLSGNIYH